MNRKYLLGSGLGGLILLGFSTLISCSTQEYNKDNKKTITQKKSPTEKKIPTETKSPTEKKIPPETKSPKEKKIPPKTKSPTSKTDFPIKEIKKTTKKIENILDFLESNIKDQEIKYDSEIKEYLGSLSNKYLNVPINPKRIKINEIRAKRDTTIRYLFKGFDEKTKELFLAAKLILKNATKEQDFKVQYIDFTKAKSAFQDLESNSKWFTRISGLGSIDSIGIMLEPIDILGTQKFDLPKGFSAKYYSYKNEIISQANKLYKTFEYRVEIKHDSSGLTSSTIFKIKYFDYMPITKLITNRVSTVKSAEEIEKIIETKKVGEPIDLSKIDYDTSAIDNNAKIQAEFNINYKFKKFEKKLERNFQVLKLIAEVKHGDLVKKHPFEIKFHDFRNAKAAITSQKAQLKTITQVEPEIKDWTIDSLISTSDIKTKMGIRTFVVGEHLFTLPSQFKISKYKLSKTPLPLGDAIDNIDRHVVVLEATILHEESNLETTKKFSIEYVDFRAILAQHLELDSYELLKLKNSDFENGKIKSSATIKEVENDFLNMDNTKMSKANFLRKMKIQVEDFPELKNIFKNNFKIEFQLNKPYKKVENAFDQSIQFKVIFTHKDFTMQKTKWITLKYADFRSVIDKIFQDQKPSTQKLKEYNRNQDQPGQRGKKSNEFKDKPLNAMEWIYNNIANTGSLNTISWKKAVRKYALADNNNIQTILNNYYLTIRPISKKLTLFQDKKLGFEIEMQGIALRLKSRIVKKKKFKISYSIIDAIPDSIQTGINWRDALIKKEFKQFLVDSKQNLKLDTPIKLEYDNGFADIFIKKSQVEGFINWFPNLNWKVYIVQYATYSTKPYLVIEFRIWQKSNFMGEKNIKKSKNSLQTR